MVIIVVIIIVIAVIAAKPVGTSGPTKCGVSGSSYMEGYTNMKPSD